MRNKGTLRQILLITDGCSNQGEDPIAMAALAHEQGITVNVIGVLNENTAEFHRQGLKEVEDIAMSGGGISQIVYATQLSQTVKMVTQKAMTQTIKGVVNAELQQILGSKSSMDDLPPDKRGEVMEVVDEMQETMNLEVLILIDASGSMEDKMMTVQESLLDLSISLNSRIGDNEFSIYAFPGKKKEVEELLSWSSKMDSIGKIFSKITLGGITPTGPAIKEGIAVFQQKRSSKRRFLSNDADGYERESSM
ncbi:VWA domain-containing protein [Fictibacillus barbaricus]|jgi:Ca-activated chloride channel family protein|uniref:Ca-activated chloride channel family protein n=1 Tax=Fictibacillus barbaricus TaxID=182136 RepID=A0ABU1U5Z4_9BACL|nr:Ca-activated chloride channel family protein [Fictibacillus barbaricus]